ncbi:MAG: hypothetical protein R2766_10140 [Saprospiraceae bacterium]
MLHSRDITRHSKIIIDTIIFLNIIGVAEKRTCRYRGYSMSKEEPGLSVSCGDEGVRDIL